MTRPDHDSHADHQFGSRAAAYVASATHASGADLARMAQALAERRPARLIDIGTGGGHVAYAAAPHCDEVIATDLSPRMLAAVEAESARRGLANVVTCACPAEALPFAQAHVDAVSSRFSAHHWNSLARGLAQARRVCRNGALALFADVVAPASALCDTHLQAVELLRDASHVRDYSAAEWTAALGQAGFAVAAILPGRLRMDFAEWTARMDTPADLAAAIRVLQQGAPREVQDHFAIEADGSFTIDTLLIEAVAV
ncbi:class I SAM-dependent methyltransferase [Novosphingobium pokkalii]|uniref:Class I SAM-dependent methyltransferase n=1 Tax=Novosphingobium pokkalii TaxID=1770194 RepID=A0ABV7UZR9_9SPHN|nr:class I SAM-dependent methyltransferase [Novosphingobium pokkalii]